MDEQTEVKRVIIQGKVQGVFYRASTKEQADRLGLRGWVRNRSDGGVEALFQGSPTAIETMLSWCWQGPPMAAVKAVESQPLDDADCLPCKGFEIRTSA